MLERLVGRRRRELRGRHVLQRVNAIEIIEFDHEPIEGTGWGFHGGVDASVFFNRIIGVDGFAKFSRGGVDLENTLGTAVGDEDVVVSAKAGGFQAGGGLRLKF